MKKAMTEVIVRDVLMCTGVCTCRQTIAPVFVCVEVDKCEMMSARAWFDQILVKRVEFKVTTTNALHFQAVILG